MCCLCLSTGKGRGPRTLLHLMPIPECSLGYNYFVISFTFHFVHTDSPCRGVLDTLIRV